jgi:predicted O-methyltransferase YrrM
VLEIGTSRGGTQFMLGAGLPTVGLRIGIDLFVWNARLLAEFSRASTRLELLHGSSRAPETIQRVREILGEEQLDLVFIDGDHAYAGVRADFENYRPLVRPGGLIAFHDIVPDALTRHGRRSAQWTGDVPRLWREVRPQFAESWEFVADASQDGFGIGVVRLPAA